MNIVTDNTKEKIYKNDADKLTQEHQERLKSIGMDKLISIKGHGFEKQYEDLKNNFHAFEDKMGLKKEEDEKENKRKQAERLKIAREKALKNYSKSVEEQKKREYYNRKINL